MDSSVKKRDRTKKRDEQGRAFEFALISELAREIAKVREVSVEKNVSYATAQSSWKTVGVPRQKTLKKSASECALSLFELEPRILEKGKDVLKLTLQTDEEGLTGDFRDLLLTREKVKWEIGLSVEHSDFDVVHTKMAKTLNFAKKWYGLDCSQEYWNDISQIFTYLKAETKLRTRWIALPFRERDIFIPMFRAVAEEIQRHYRVSGSMFVQRVVEHLMGRFDFYKIPSPDENGETQIQAFNLRGTLNKPAGKAKLRKVVPETEIPARILSLDFKPESGDTLEMFLEGGWQIDFHINSKNPIVEVNLRLDIQIMRLPETVVVI
jgi:hypothetical protein